MSELIERAKSTLKWFSPNSLLGQLVEEVERLTEDRNQWRGHALKLEEEVDWLRKELGSAAVANALLTLPKARRSIRDLLPVFRSRALRSP